jgi:hypothetical protein
VNGPEVRSVIVDEERRFQPRSLEEFDRIAFAMRALRILGPEHLRVLVYSASSRLSVERGRDLVAADTHPDASWALVGIPPDASRESIAVALAELTGTLRAPFLLDLLVGSR